MEYYLAHHGVKGQKWGVRRYQNEDGTLTAEGRRHSKLFYNASDRAHYDFRKEDRAERKRLNAENKLAYMRGEKTAQEYKEDAAEIKKEYKQQRKASKELEKELRANKAIGEVWAEQSIKGTSVLAIGAIGELSSGNDLSDPYIASSLGAAVLSIPISSLIETSKIKKQRRINEAKYGVTYNDDGTVNERVKK